MIVTICIMGYLDKFEYFDVPDFILLLIGDQDHKGIEEKSTWFRYRSVGRHIRFQDGRQ